MASILAGLTSVLSYDAETGEIFFYHTSLPDFLWDKKERSQNICVFEMCTDLSILWFQNAGPNHFHIQYKHQGK